MIKTSIGNGIAQISIYGIKEEVEYEVEISSKILSYISYKVIYENLKPEDAVKDLMTRDKKSE